MEELKKYLVSVPVLARVEVYVDARNESEAKELGMFKAENNKDDINHETMMVLGYDDTIDETTNTMIEFGITQGYEAWDCKEEFGD